MSIKVTSLIFCFFVLSCASLTPTPTSNSTLDPSELYGELFKHIQLTPAYEDSKYFIDMIPKRSPDKIMDAYRLQNPKTKEDLVKFVDQEFRPPLNPDADFKSQPNETIEQHIKTLWTFLRREPLDDVDPASSLIPLPHAYIVPGGRFREIYYWDSYFSQLGLLADGEEETFKSMVKNLAYLSLTIGRIPNGNRDYYRSRSQPPFFSHMVALWQMRFGKESALEFLPALQKEYDFWMSGERVVRIGSGELNRYWDDKPEPRPEAYKEDTALAKKSKRPEKEVYRDLRAAAESGWDFSTRWFEDPLVFESIQTTSIVPVDLNSLVYHLEQKISELLLLSGDHVSANRFSEKANRRRELIHRFLWDQKAGVFRDYNWKEQKPSREMSIAMVVPLFAGVASENQAKLVAKVLEKTFLKRGGLVTTLRRSGQQWDSPNGWPPHQWMGYAGLKRYHLDALAEKLRGRWLALNQRVFKSTGKLVEKYDVINIDLKSGGGEYPLQDGFGWTNGVYRAMSSPEEFLRHTISK